MNAYLDASVISVLLLKDDHWRTIAEWLGRSDVEASLSDFGVGEFTSAVAKRYRSGAAALSQAEAMLAACTALTTDWGNILMTSQDIADATAMVANFELGLRLPDAIHIAIARRIGQMLITSDKKQARAADLLDVPVFNPLRDVQ